jgi:hypothetical protein
LLGNFFSDGILGCHIPPLPLAAYKACSPPPPHVRRAAVRATMAACTGSSRPQATLDQIERIITAVDLHPKLPNCPLPRRRCSIAGTAVAAATAVGRRCPLASPLPAPTKHRNQPPGTRGSFPARARPVPAAGSPEFGRTAAGRCSGTTLRSPKSS